MSCSTRPLRWSMVLALILQLQTRAHEVTVEVESAKTVVVIGEPVLVSATVVNHRNEPVTLIHHNAPTLDESTLSVVDLQLAVDDEPFNHWSDRLRPRNRTAPRTLPPGGSITVDLVMLFNSKDGFFADHPGRYWIRGRIVAHDLGELLSPPLAIDVRAPIGFDSSTWQWLGTHKEEYGRMVQVPWDAELSDAFLLEAGKRCEGSQSAYSEYLALFLSRAYREGPQKDAELAAHFAEIAKARATRARIRSEAEKILRSPRIEAPPAPPPEFASEVDAATQRAVTEALEKFAAALTGGRMNECAAMLSEDFLRNGVQDKARTLANLEGDLAEHPGSVASIVVDSVLGNLAGDEVEVSGRLVGRMPGRQMEEHQTRWVLRREGASWLIRRWDRTSSPGGAASDPSRSGP